MFKTSRLNLVIFSITLNVFACIGHGSEPVLPGGAEFGIAGSEAAITQERKNTKSLARWGRDYCDKQMNLHFRFVQPGWVLMGFVNAPPPWRHGLSPIVLAHVSEGFYISESLVSIERWSSAVDSKGQGPPAGIEATAPMSWYEAAAFLHAANLQDDSAGGSAWRYRMPTEVEWELAYSQLHTGGIRPCLTCASDQGYAPESIGYGRDGPGEWCLDYFAPNVFAGGTLRDPFASNATVVPYYLGQPWRVVRGGGRHSGLIFSRHANRSGSSPSRKQIAVGLRVVRGPTRDSSGSRKELQGHAAIADYRLRATQLERHYGLGVELAGEEIRHDGAATIAYKEAPDIDRVIGIDVISRELARYCPRIPKAAGLNRLVLCRDLKLKGIECSGVADVAQGSLYIDVTSHPGKIRKSLHHEIWHFLESTYYPDLDAKGSWQQVSDVRVARASPNSRSDSEERRTHFRGYINQHSTHSPTEDRAELYEYMICNPELTARLAFNDDVLRAKVLMMAALVQGLGAIALDARTLKLD